MPEPTPVLTRMTSGAANRPDSLSLWGGPGGIVDLTAHWEAAVRAAHDSGMSYRAIAAAAGCSLGRVQRIVARG